jgi:class 3 adenylate cyclase
MDAEVQLNALRSFRLEFETELERLFRWDYFHESLRHVRFALLLAALLFCAFGYLDAALIPQVRAQLWLIRYGFCVPLILAIFAFTFTPWFERASQPVIGAGSLLVGVGLIAMTLIAPPPGGYLYYVSVCQVLIYTYAFLKLRFLPATIVGSSLTLIYFAGAWSLGRTPGIILLSNMFAIVTFEVVGVVICFTMELYIRRNFLQKHLLAARNAEIQKQQALAETLLLDILPSEVAEELKTKGAVSPRYFEDVTILFTDFQGFTLATERLSADELVALLHRYFSAFDEVTAKYSLEKLKTIGDSYMCVGGLPVRSPSHCVDAVLGGFEIIEQVQRLNQEHGIQWNIRVGLHTGPVISGVVGIRKFAFDVWGESVNFASRMESSGSPNRLNVSTSTAARVKDFFRCESRGKVETKDHREYEMYFVEAALPSLVGATASGVPEPFAARYRLYFGKDLKTFPKSLISGSSRRSVS